MCKNWKNWEIKRKRESLKNSNVQDKLYKNIGNNGWYQMNELHQTNVRLNK